MRLIDADAAVEVADAVWMVTGDKNVAKVWDQIKNLPTVDAVPVIRCKDCRYSSERKHNLNKKHCTWWYRSVYDEDYCSRAERTEE